MEYRTMTSKHLAELRVERVVELEQEHVRCSMRLEDAQSVAEHGTITRELLDLEARIAVHVAVIEAEPDEPGEQGDDESDTLPDGPDAESEPEPDGPAALEASAD